MPGKMRVTKLRVTSDDKSVECSGTYLLEGQQRFGAPCYTRMGRAGAEVYRRRQCGGSGAAQETGRALAAPQPGAQGRAPAQVAQ